MRSVPPTVVLVHQFFGARAYDVTRNHRLYVRCKFVAATEPISLFAELEM